MANESAAPAPVVGGIHHVFVTVNNLARSRPFYAALMPRLGYPALWDYGFSLGWMNPNGSFWIKQADARYVGETFCKDRVGLCEIAFRADSRAQIDALARDIPAWGGTILDPPREYPEYVPGYYAVFFADPDGIKLEFVHLPS
ncbi:MAG: VOC family protein [Deltaproteobacteria bacterium]|nr:VOC family protein [Deltaproteobacteria bacterium]